MFADTDFLLALLKPSDWLKGNALKILKKNKGNISTSLSCALELALLCKRLHLPINETFANLFELVSINEKDRIISLRAATYISRYDFNVFDAFHAASCEEDVIISSDKVYDRIGLKRVDLKS
tara:strand:- start:575 stop:943 length:369 start_codon:yes stop_codon:yes gene_type:complete